MYVLSAKLQQLAIISLQTGETVGYTAQPLVDPAKLHIVAFRCQGTPELKHPVLMTQDVRQLAQQAILIDSATEVGEADEIVRLAPLLQQRQMPVGLPVENESGQKLGRVEDFAVNIETFLINKIYLRRSLIKSLLNRSLVIDRSQIVDVQPKRIVVRDASVAELALSYRPSILPGS